MSISFKKILLAGTALVAVSAFAASAQAAPVKSLASGDFTSGVYATDAIGVATASAGDNSADVGQDAIDLASAITSGFTINANVNAAAGGASSGGGAAKPGGVGGIGFWANGTTPNTLIFGLTGSAKTITGGNGGAETAAAAGAAGGAGGAGGIAIKIDAAANNYTINEAVTGGNGGTAQGATGANAGGAGGAGATAILSSSTTTTLTLNAAVAGGTGANGGGTTGAASGGVGGAAGIGVSLTGTSATLNIGANVTGGTGGTGGNNVGAATAGLGVAGGIGVNLTNTGDTVSITAGTVAGGASGNHGTGGNNTTAGVVGGVGLLDSSTGESITISNGAIVKGGAGGIGAAAGAAGTAALSGAAVSLTGATATLFSNAGTIGDATTQTGAALNLATAVTTFANTGTIVGAGTTVTAASLLVAADQTAAWTNAGTIRAAGAGATATAVDFTATQTGAGLTNSGTISAIGSGTTAAPTGTAVNFLTAGKVTNTGTVLGNITDTGAVAETFTNKGTFTGNVVFGQNSAHTVDFFSGTAASVGGAGSKIYDGSAGATSDTLTQEAGTVTGNVLLGTGANTFTQTGGTLTGNITGTLGGGDTLTLGGGTVTGNIDLITGANAINVNGAFTTGGTITATGGGVALTVQNGGTLNVANAITALTGAVVSQTGGLLNVNASGSITNSGVLQTTGTGAIHLVGGDITSTGAYTNNGTTTIDAGRTLTANTQVAADSAYAFGMKGNNTTGQPTAGLITLAGGALNLSNSATKSTITVNVDSASGYITSGKVVKIATGNAAATKSFNNTSDAVAVAVTSDNSTLYSFQYARGDNAVVRAADAASTSSDIYLIATRATAASLGVTDNSGAVDAALTTIGATGTAELDALQGQLSAAATASAVENILATIVPTADGSAAAGAMSSGAQVQGIAETRIASLRSGDALSGVAAGAAANGWSLWAQGYGQHGVEDTKDSVAGYHATTWGGAVGVDSTAMISNSIIGVSFNYGRTNADSKNANTTTTDVDNYGFNAYGSYDLGQQYFVNGQLGYAYNKISSDRHDATGPGLGVTATGDTHSDQYAAKLGVGRDYAADHGLTLTPSVTAGYTHLVTAGYTETGAGGADLIVGSNSLNSLKLGIGGQATWNLKNSDGSTTKPAVRLGYAYEALNDRIDLTSSFTGDAAGTAFATQGPKPDRSEFDAGLGLTYMTTANWDLSANYDYTYKTHYDGHTGVLRATSHF
ncbi:MAG: autotransporter domain-containing protein [Proteobacteria bacterium]|nr:autotransporter domain-containing protein [Pseudomonadota bacterium]